MCLCFSCWKLGRESNCVSVTVEPLSSPILSLHEPALLNCTSTKTTFNLRFFHSLCLLDSSLSGRTGGGGGGVKQQDVSLCDTSSLIYYATPLATEHKNGLGAFSSNGGETRSFDLYHRLLSSGVFQDNILATF
jgi:hypothetical protein